MEEEKDKWTTMIYKALHRKLNIEQHKLHLSIYKSGDKL